MHRTFARTAAMQETLLEPLLTVASQRPDALISEAAWARIARLAAGLPGGSSSFFGFECPLGADAERVDFLFCSTRDEGHTQVLAATAPRAADPAWQAVRALCKAWNGPDAELDGLHNLWLEFDVGSQPQTHAVERPSLFFGLQPRSAGPALASRALGVVEPAALAGARAALLRRLFDALPDSAYVFQIGVMLARDAPAIRVCVRQIDVEGVARLLTRLGWAGDRTALGDLIASLALRAERVDLDLDLGDEVGPRIGLECYPGSDDAVAARLSALTDWLLARELCSTQQAAALVRYQGLTHPRAVSTPWPASWLTVARARGDAYESCVCRWVHHVKLVFEAGAPRAAKAYLAAEHVPLDRRQLARAIDARRRAVQP